MKPIRSQIVNAALVTACLASSNLVNAHEQVHKAPWEACEDASRSHQCAYTNGNGDLFRGTCQSFNNELMCVRNKPIVYATDLGNGDSSHYQEHTHDINLETAEQSIN